MKKMRWIIWVVVTITIISGVSIAFYHNLYNSNIEVIQAQAKEMEALNCQLENVTEQALEVLENNKQWRLDSLYTEKMQREEFQNFLDACIIYQGTTTIVAEVDQNHSKSIRAEIKTSPVFKNDMVQSNVKLEFDYSYNIIHKDQEIYYEQSYIDSQIGNFKVMSICVGLLSGLLSNIIGLTIFKRKVVKS